MATELESLVLSISADTSALKRALLRTQKDAKDTADSVGKSFDNVVPFQRMEQSFSRSSKAMANDAKVLSFQFNDLFTQISSGTSVTQAFNQQIGQIGQSFQGLRSIGAGASLIGQALLGMVPTLALTGAFAAITFAASQYFDTAEDGSEEARKALEKHVDELQKVVSAYGTAVPELARILEQLKKAGETEALKSVTASEISKAYEPIKQSIREIAPAVQDARAELIRLGKWEEAAELRRKFADLIKATDEEKASTKELSGFTAELTRIMAAAGAQGVNPLVASLNKLITAYDEASRSAKALSDQQKATDFSNPITGPSMGPGGPIDMRGANYSIGAQNEANAAAEAKKRGENDAKAYMLGLEPEFKTRLKAFIAAAQSEAGSIVVNSGKRSTERQAQLWAQALQKYGTPEKARKWVAPPGHSMHEKGGAADLGYESEAVKQWAHANAEAYGLVFRLKNEDWHIEMKANETRKEKKKTLDDVMLSEKQAVELNQQIAAINADTSLTESERQFQIDKLTISTKLLNEAKAAGVTLDANALAQIDATSSALARQEQSEKQLTAAKRERTQAAVEARQTTEQLVSAGLSTFVSELRAGASAADALRSALNRVLDVVIQIAINSITKSIGGSLFPTMHSGGTVGSMGANRRVSPLAFAGAPRMHSGGVAGLRPGEVPIIAQKGEIVLPKGALKRSAPSGGGGVTNNIAVDVSTGAVVANNQDAKQLGLQINKAVEAVLVRERRPGGLLRAGV